MGRPRGDPYRAKKGCRIKPSGLRAAAFLDDSGEPLTPNHEPLTPKLPITNYSRREE